MSDPSSCAAGDISASTPAEMLVSVCINLLGIIFLGFVIATSQYAPGADQ